MSSILYGYLGSSTQTVLSLEEKRARQARFKSLLGHSNQSQQHSRLISSLIDLHMFVAVVQESFCFRGAWGSCGRIKLIFQRDGVHPQFGMGDLEQ